jgi:hypothetical protein
MSAVAAVATGVIFVLVFLAPVGMVFNPRKDSW